MDDAPQPQRTRIDADSNHDYLTNLPPNVKDNILTKLPIKEAVRTSILSTKWLDSWVSIPNLVFQEYHTVSLLIKMVDMVLLSHQGPIQQFKLSSFNVGSEAISRWLFFLSRNSIKDLQLLFAIKMRREEKCKIPFRLISCQVLECLSLCYCAINIPSFFQGFKQLRTLILYDCDLFGISIEKMVSSCPLLNHLELCFVRPLQGCLRICASNLTYLSIHGSCKDVCLETPKLASACIRLVDTHGQMSSVSRDRKEMNIIHALGFLSNIQKLKADGAFIQNLAIGPIPENLPAIFNQLTDLSVSLNMKQNEISGVLCLLENAPNLEVLFIEFLYTDEPNVEAVWESKSIQDHLFKHLKVVKIMYVYDSRISLQFTKSVLEFARLVLTTAPVLEKLKFIGLEQAVAIFEMLKWLPKLSKNAEIALS